MRKQSQDSDQIYQYLAMSEAGKEARRSEAVTKGFLGGVVVAFLLASITFFFGRAFDEYFIGNLLINSGFALVPGVIGGLAGMRRGSPGPFVMGAVFTGFTLSFCIISIIFLAQIDFPSY